MCRPSGMPTTDGSVTELFEDNADFWYSLEMNKRYKLEIPCVRPHNIWHLLVTVSSNVVIKMK